METPTAKCPACQSEKFITNAKLATESELQVFVYGKRKSRETWKDPVVIDAKSPVTVRICANCGHISLWTKDLAKIRAASEKLGDEPKL